MASPKITLYVDIVSPFAYMAFYALRHFPVFNGCEITYIPIFLGGLMHACDNKPPLQIRNKAAYIETNRQRLANLFQIPISSTPPPNFPINTLSIQRVLASLSLLYPLLLPSGISAFYQNFWVHYNEPTKPENMLKIVSEVVGSEEEAKRVVDGSARADVKKALTENTERAFADGAFGLPWFVATNSKGETEGFWGIDHLGFMCDHLGLDKPSDRGWKALL
ncbi:thioredoxin-like protein [Massariosphaeria phaeospora]|uniref:Glutathione S-transferase kappa n=1 Tax=Massariosphaeria phaeospora TaxID=100035 RepID=A0A7C8IHH7_9PLEO|nr:thioredoxin-like protein [Massariosphaeria phaeospora]